MGVQHYRITTDTGKEFFAEVPEGKKLKAPFDDQMKIWYENIEGSKYRGRGIEVLRIKEVPIKGARWLSINHEFMMSTQENPLI